MTPFAGINRSRFKGLRLIRTLSALCVALPCLGGTTLLRASTSVLRSSARAKAPAIFYAEDVSTAEDFLLIATDPDSGKPMIDSTQSDPVLGGAILFDLVAAGRLSLDGEGRKARVVVTIRHRRTTR